MTLDTGSRGLRFSADRDTVQLFDVRCGRCAPCRVGRDYWCQQERASGPVLAEIVGVTDVDRVRRWTTALAALAVTRRAPSAALLVLADVAAEPVRELVGRWHAGPVVVAAEARDAGMREQLAALSATGRAPLVITVSDVRAAVRAVERGGQVCGPDAETPLPSVTELVQRDVTLVAPRSVDSLVASGSWAELGTALTTLLAQRVAGVAR